VLPNFTEKSGFYIDTVENMDEEISPEDLKTAYSVAKKLLMPAKEDKDGNYMNNT
jgi:hypothetical protein